MQYKWKIYRAVTEATVYHKVNEIRAIICKTMTFTAISSEVDILHSLHSLTLLTIVSRLLVAVPVHLPIIISMHFLWIAALHSG